VIRVIWVFKGTRESKVSVVMMDPKAIRGRKAHRETKE
jgi:hypothetical protein